MRVAVLGQGMLGGSLQAALVAAGWAASGWDPEPGVRKRMRQRGLESEATPDRALRGAGISVLCAPPRGILELLGSPALKGFPGVVTDVGSVKREIARAGRRALGSRFVPGHPMAGAAESGVGAQRPDLFRDRIWVLAGGSADARTVVRRMVRRVGAHPVEMTPARHDQLVAWTSHLPQILAWMVAYRAERHGNLPEGPAYAALSRLAGSPWELWREILEANGDNVRAALGRLHRDLGQVVTEWHDAAPPPARLARKARRAKTRRTRPD